MIWAAIAECDAVAGMDGKSCPIRVVCHRVPRSQRQEANPSGQVWREGHGDTLRFIG